MDKKCLDTYALMEISFGNPNFSSYVNENFVITDLTLVEFYGVLLREQNIQTANYWFKKLKDISVPVGKEILKEAVKFRYDHRKQDISFFDAAGYIFSVVNNILFVTGDKEFEGLPNVEFVK
jgi:hypothetical protein